MGGGGKEPHLLNILIENLQGSVQAEPGVPGGDYRVLRGKRGAFKEYN